MNSIQLVQNDRITDGRRARSWWHEKAKEMIGEGFELSDIAKHYRVTESAVRYAVRGMQTPRKLPRGNYHQVNTRFNDEQMAKIKALAVARGKSFAAIVASLIDEALSDQPSEFERCMK